MTTSKHGENYSNVSDFSLYRETKFRGLVPSFEPKLREELSKNHHSYAILPFRSAHQCCEP